MPFYTSISFSLVCLSTFLFPRAKTQNKTAATERVKQCYYDYYDDYDDCDDFYDYDYYGNYDDYSNYYLLCL